MGHDLIEEARNQACVELGPLVYCLESAALPKGAALTDVLLPLDPDFIQVPEETEGRAYTALEGTLLLQHVDEALREALYRPLDAVEPEAIRARLIPYYAWDNKGWGEMSVWLPLSWRRA